ncbi:MAG: hypothetical protein WD005_03450 [Haliea sp.]
MMQVARWLIGLTLIAIAVLQVFYWVFANSAEPIVLGLPFGMFFVSSLIGIEFFALLALYFFDQSGDDKK